MKDESSAPVYRSVRQNPWWIPPFLGGVPDGVEPAHLRVLGFVTLAMFFENYDLGMFGNALPQIAATFGLDKAAQGEFTAMDAVRRAARVPAAAVRGSDRAAPDPAALDRGHERRLVRDRARAVAAPVRDRAARHAHVASWPPRSRRSWS